MAAATSTAYSTTAGGKIYGGRPGSGPSPIAGDILIDGDSISDLNYPFRASVTGLGLTRKTPRVVANVAVFGQNTTQRTNALAAALDANPTVKIIMCRVGTNDDPNSTNIAEYSRYLSIASARGVFVMFHAVPPRGPTVAGTPSGKIAKNAAIKSICDADPTKAVFISDCQRLASDVYYNPVAALFVDSPEIHPAPLGMRYQAEDMAPLIAPYFPAAEIRLTDPADIYPANSTSSQYVQNPFNTGTGGGLYMATGVVPDNVSLSCGLGSGSGITASIVAADVGDANQAPWLQMAYTKGVTNNSNLLAYTLKHPAIAADATIKRYDVVAEVQFVNFDTTNVGYMHLRVNRADGTLETNERNMIGNSGVLNEKLIIRNAYSRDTTVAQAANSLKLSFVVDISSDFTANIGAIKIRCVSMRGSST